MLFVVFVVFSHSGVTQQDSFWATLSPDSLKFYQRYLWRRKKSHGRAPRARSAVHIERTRLAHTVEPSLPGIKEPGDQIERKDLPTVSMAAQLQVEPAQRFLLYRGSVFEKQGKSL